MVESVEEIVELSLLYDFYGEMLDEHKKKIFEDSLNKILEDLVDANMFRFAKISNREDDDYYRLIKEYTDWWNIRRYLQI